MVRLTRSITRNLAARVSRVLAMVLAGMAALAPITWSVGAWAAEPKPWQLGFQPAATPVQERIEAFHDGLWPPGLMVIITLITIFVFGLTVYVMWRFHHTRHPVPTRTSHNAVIEILWTVVPVLILGAIVIPSFKLMYYMDRVPDAEMTIKVTAHQWYWEYGYPDQGDLTFNSNMIPEKELKPGQKRLLSVDNPLVVPVNTKIRVLVTGTDVIHSWFVPSFGIQQYAIAGRLNETWMQVNREGTYHGECNQICGVNHAFMPIEVKAVSKPEYEKWLGEAKKKFAAAGPENSATLVAAAATADGQPAQSFAKPASLNPAGN